MCKHILFNNFQASDLGALRQFTTLTHENDGYGAILRTSRGLIEAYKSLDVASFYIELTERILRGDVKTLVVHHRTSTNVEGLDYAHPFEFDGNWMTHNGVVSVPGEHDTATQNDSEALLHHLIKSEYDTLPVEGYFSCFVLNEAETILLVDAIAPIYTDGRVYSSHKLDGTFVKIELVKRVLHPMSGKVLVESTIEVTKSNYGQGLRSLSLGACADDVLGTYSSDLVSDFFDIATDDDIERVYLIRDAQEKCQAIQELGYAFGLDLMPDDIEVLEDWISHFSRGASRDCG